MSQPTSPYKKLKVTNQAWIGFTNISKLEPNKAYKMLNITETNHSEYGPGQQATIQAHDGKKWRTQLPGKYLSQLSKDDINFMKQDIVVKKKNVFLVFREKMLDNSYRIDITENDTWLVNFNKHEDVPELEVSIEEEEGSALETPKESTEEKEEGNSSEKYSKEPHSAP